jgi:hypothetical protein
MLVSQHTTIKADLALGLKNQSSLLITLRSKFGDSLVETQNKYCKWDFIDSLGNHYEVKSRRISKEAYPTTLLPAHKILQTPVRQFFIFKYIDKVSYIEYNEAVFNTFTTGLVTDARQGRHDLHFFIPITALIDI